MEHVQFESAAQQAGIDFTWSQTCALRLMLQSLIPTTLVYFISVHTCGSCNIVQTLNTCFRVSHFSYAPLFQRPHCLTKMLESNTLYDNLLIDILSLWWHRKKVSKSLMRDVLLRQRQFWQTCTCNLNVYIFYLSFALGIIHGDRCDRKTPITIISFKKKNIFSVVEFSNTVTFFKKCSFWRHINVSYSNQTGFPSQIVLLWATCWQWSIKTLKNLFIDTSYSLCSSDVITNVNTMTPTNPLFFYENKWQIHGCLKWNYKKSFLITSLIRIIRNFN